MGFSAHRFRFFYLPILTIFFLLSQNSVATAIEIRAVTSNFAPLQMEKNDKLDGYTVIIIQEMLSRLKTQGTIKKYQIDLLPWKRAMRAAEQNKNTLFFSLSRTEKREDKFQWISEISPYEIYLFKLKFNHLPPIETLADVIDKDIKISAPIGSNTEDLYQQNGLEVDTNYILYRHYNNGIPMLFGNRFDAIPLTAFVARTNTCAIGLDGDQLERYFPIKELSNPLWLVASKQTPPELVQEMREIMETLHQEGFIKTTQDKYINQWLNMPCRAKS